MAGPVFADGVAEYTLTQGTTRPYVLSGQVPPGGRKVSAAVTTGDWGYFEIAADGGPGREWIRGRLTSATQLTVIEIVASTNGGAAVNWPVGNRRTARLIPAAAAYLAGLADEMFWTVVVLGVIPDLGNLADDITAAVDMGDIDALAPSGANDLVQTTDMGEEES